MADEDFEWCDVCDDCSHYKAVGDEKYQCTLEGGRCRGYFAYKKLKAENAELRDRLRITKMALEYSCLESVQGNEQFLDEMQKKVNKYMEQAEDVFNSEKNGISFTFAEARLAELKGEEK